MKCCLTYAQSPLYLQKVEEIKIPWTQRDKLSEFAEQYPDKTFILQFISPSKKLPLEEVYKIYEQIDNTLILCVGSVENCALAYNNDLPFYYAFPITSYAELNGVISFDPEYIIVGAPLFFNLPYIKKLGIPIRIFPNIGNFSQFGMKDSAHGTWVRPEDIDYYGQFVDAYEFGNMSLEQERALFRLYFKEKRFIGPLGLIIPELREDYNAHSDLIDGKLVMNRIKCKQRCESGETNCHLCETALNLANPERYEYLLKK